MGKKTRKRKGKQQASRLARSRTFSAGDIFMAVLGAALLVLFGVLIVLAIFSS